MGWPVGSLVSILSGSSEPLQREVTPDLEAAVPVSILSGSSEPLQPNSPGSGRVWRRFQSSAARRSRCNATLGGSYDVYSEFQSSAARRSRCNDWASSRDGRRAWRFNPQRLVGAAATTTEGGESLKEKVSILSGSSEPLQPGDGREHPHQHAFQSSAARRSRCN